MCHTLITRCVECKKLIDSVVRPCKKHRYIKIDDKDIGYCPANKSLDGYAINPGTGQPFPPKQLLNLEGEYYRHRVKQMTSLCFWCRGNMSGEYFENKRSDYYNRCSDVADMVADGNGNCLLAEPEIRHELWDLGDNGVPDYKAYWRPKDDAKVGLAPVANGAPREATHKPPVELLTRQEQFLWFEPTEVIRPDFPVEDLWLRSQAECPLMNLLGSSVKRNRATVEADTTLEAPAKKAKINQSAKEAVESAGEYDPELEEFDSSLDFPMPSPLPLALQPANTLGATPDNTLESPLAVEATTAAVLPQDQHYNRVPTPIPADHPADALENLFGNCNTPEFPPVDQAPTHPADVPLGILFNDVFDSPPVDEATTAAVLDQDQHYDPAPAPPLDDLDPGSLPEFDLDNFLEVNSYLNAAPAKGQPDKQDSGFYDGRDKTPELDDARDNMFQDLDLFPDLDL